MRDTTVVSATNNLKTMGRGHVVHERQAILSTAVVISHTFSMAKKNELTPRRAWQQSRDPIVQIGHCMTVLPVLTQCCGYKTFCGKLVSVTTV